MASTDSNQEVYKVIPLGEGFWAIQDALVRMYLMDGTERALLIDTGYGSGDLAALVESLVHKDPKKDVTVINTHSHGDHTSANAQFASFCMSEADASEIRPACPEDAQIRLVSDGEKISAGDFDLEVVAISGHTPGSIALLDRQHRRIFTADSVAKNFPVYMQFPGQDIENYCKALHKLRTLKDSYDTLWPCHGELYITLEDLDNTIACCEGILDGTIAPGTAENSEHILERAYWNKDIAIFH